MMHVEAIPPDMWGLFSRHLQLLLAELEEVQLANAALYSEDGALADLSAALWAESAALDSRLQALYGQPLEKTVNGGADQ
jgi:hypothetical protein